MAPDKGTVAITLNRSLPCGYRQVPPNRAQPPGRDTLSLRLEDGLIGLVGVLHSDGVGELVQHSLLEGLQSLVVMPSAHKLLILRVQPGKKLGSYNKDKAKNYVCGNNCPHFTILSH